ncbi:DinB family protein [Phycisphaera mikurensis]|uniref:DinB family protein n=1 Tax=Phycisphaera mikurensis (strain NBRC 102666 / KCTC 22515 / FYK2301M01) TaxID=1142394 RepID=I0II68_PHYMF|nr:DinB family protein [Phycisphaera mikurensis]MBB6442481.1 putative damage-inducible protein DinB [Phycisphaera mikurensis]BAM04956.1 DinB family protein [Phycisphaera mikurensis NBRC 102666]
MTAVDWVRRMHAHKRWANRRLLEAVEDLPEKDRHRSFGIGHGSAWATVVHLWAVDAAWLETIGGREDAPVVKAGAVGSVEALEALWDVADERWVTLLAGLEPEDLDRPVWRTSAATGGRRRGMPLHDVLIHVCTHAQYTGSQCVNILRRLRVAELPRISMTTLSRAGFEGR